MNPGSLFPALYKMEQDAKLEAEWRASENNRNAKYYKLTRAGKKQLTRSRNDGIASRWRLPMFSVNVLSSAKKAVLH